MTRKQQGTRGIGPTLPTKNRPNSRGNDAVPMVSGRPTKNKRPRIAGPVNGTRSGGDLRYGAYGGFGGIPYSRARRLASATIRDELRGLRPEIGAANRQYDRSIGDINYLFGESGDYINYQNNLMAQQNTAARTQAQQLASQLSAQLASNGTQAQSGANSELSRMGLGQAEIPGYFAADQANAQNVASIMGANSDSNLAMMGTAGAQVGNLLAGANAASKASAAGRAMGNRDEMIAKVRDAMRQMKGSRKDLTLQLLEQLAQSG